MCLLHLEGGKNQRARSSINSNEQTETNCEETLTIWERKALQWDTSEMGGGGGGFGLCKGQSSKKEIKST
jgi:hypothetical protein